MSRSTNYGVYFFNLILFIYPVELFEVVHIDGILGAYTPFRMIILPLCLLYIIMYKNYFPKNGGELLSVGFFFMMGAIGTLSSSFSSFFSFLGNIFQFLMAYNFVKNNTVGRSTLITMTLWIIVQVPAFFMSFLTGTFGIELRFKGFFFDPNYLCAFILAGVWSAVYLLKEATKKSHKLYYYSIIGMGLIMIFVSFSRGGLLAVLLTLLAYLLVYKRKVFILITAVSIPLVSTMMVRSKFLTWSDAANNPFDAFIYRVFTMSSDADQLTSNRSDYLNIFIKNIDEYILFGTDVFDWNEKYNGGQFVHNGFVELLIQGSVIFGIIFIVRFIWSLIRCFLLEIKYKSISSVWVIFLSSIIALTFLSYTSKYAWLCLGALFALNDINTFKKQII